MGTNKGVDPREIAPRVLAALLAKLDALEPGAWQYVSAEDAPRGLNEDHIVHREAARDIPYSGAAPEAKNCRVSVEGTHWRIGPGYQDFELVLWMPAPKTGMAGRRKFHKDVAPEKLARVVADRLKLCRELDAQGAPGRDEARATLERLRDAVVAAGGADEGISQSEAAQRLLLSVGPASGSAKVYHSAPREVLLNLRIDGKLPASVAEDLAVALTKLRGIQPT